MLIMERLLSLPEFKPYFTQCACRTGARSLTEKLCGKYDNLSEVDTLSGVTAKVESVKLVMQENVRARAKRARAQRCKEFFIAP